MHLERYVRTMLLKTQNECTLCELYIGIGPIGIANNNGPFFSDIGKGDK